MKAQRIVGVLFCLLLAGRCTKVVVADDAAEARKLKEEAVKILQSGSAMAVEPAIYADCVLKLEKAIQLLESGQARDENLLQEATSALYWARKFTTVNHINAIQRKRGEPVKPRKKPAPPPVPSATQVSKEAPTPLADAKRLYQKGEIFAQSRSGNHYAVALQWFQIADQISGTDYAVKALGKAREAQEKFQANKRAKEPDPKPVKALSKMTKEAQRLANSGELDAAIGIYVAAAKKEGTPEAYRRLGHAYFQRGQQVKETLLARFEAAESAYREAYTNALVQVRSSRGTFYRLNRRDPKLLEVWRDIAALQKEAEGSFVYYDKAKDAFSMVLKFAKNGRDLDAAGHKCLCLSARGAMVNRLRARQELLGFIKSYKPANDVERTLYAFCETEFERIKAKPPGQY